MSRFSSFIVLLSISVCVVVISQVGFLNKVIDDLDLRTQLSPVHNEDFRLPKQSKKKKKSKLIKEDLDPARRKEQLLLQEKKEKGGDDQSNTGGGDGRGGHQVAGLNCDRYGGPSEEIAAEMVYWRDIPSDSDFVSPFAKYGPEKKYLTFEPDEGGWNNIRMGMETAVALAFAMGRTLVLPFEQNIYLLRNDRKKKNRFTFNHFYHFDSIAEEHTSVQVISSEEFMKDQVMNGLFKDGAGNPIFPPMNKTDWDGHIRNSQQYYNWIRNVTGAPKWEFDHCFVGLPSEAGNAAATRLEKGYGVAKKKKMSQKYIDNPTPVDGSVEDRMAEMIGHRQGICVYDDHYQQAPVMHFMGDNASGARLLVHFYAYLFFENWEHDLITKRFIRDHLRYIDEIQCAAARVVNAVREISKKNGDPSGVFDTFHIRRGDFQYKDTRVSADEIYDNVQDFFVEGSTVFVATDERDMTFFEPLRKHYKLYFLHDFHHLLTDVNKNYYGMLDQLVASRGRTFAGSFFSTFTGYINRIRGHHSQKNKLPGHEKGQINSIFYIPKRVKHGMRHYQNLQPPLWAREFPIAWRDIDHNVDGQDILS